MKTYTVDRVKGLYQNHYNHDDHIKIGNLIQNEISHRWVVSYDDVKPIRTIYKERRKKMYGIGYSARDVYQSAEVGVKEFLVFFINKKQHYSNGRT